MPRRATPGQKRSSGLQRSGEKAFALYADAAELAQRDQRIAQLEAQVHVQLERGAASRQIPERPKRPLEIGGSLRIGIKGERLLPGALEVLDRFWLRLALLGMLRDLLDLLLYAFRRQPDELGRHLLVQGPVCSCSKLP